MEKLEHSGVPPVSAWHKIQIYFHLLNHVLISSVAIYMTFLCYQTGNLPISWHAWLCTIGYQLLMTQAIMAFYSQNVWSQKHSQPVKRLLHWVLHAIGSSMAMAGMYIEYANRRKHLHSKHAIIGFIAGIFTLIGMVNGSSALWSVELRKLVAPVYLKVFHKLTGVIAFVLGMVALYYGYDKKYMIKNSRADIRMYLQALAVITIILSLIGVLNALKNHARTVLRI